MKAKSSSKVKPKAKSKKKSQKRPAQNTKPASPEEIDRIKALLKSGRRKDLTEAKKALEALSKPDYLIVVGWAAQYLGTALDLSIQKADARRERLGYK